MITFLILLMIVCVACNTSNRLSNNNITITGVTDKPGSTPASSENNERASQIEEIENEAKPLDLKNGWIKATDPVDNSDHSYPNKEVREIIIYFNEDMDESTLNSKTILIFSEKHSTLVSNMFSYNYKPELRALVMAIKEPVFNLGSGNGIEIFISKKVKNIEHEEMGTSVYFGYSQ